MNVIICISLLLFTAPLLGHAQSPLGATTSFIYTAQDARKLADLGADEELWTMTLLRESSSSNTPASLTLISRIKRPKKPRKYIGPWPDGTELRMQLTRRADGSYETVYYRTDMEVERGY